jgi:hypothetical protein
MKKILLFLFAVLFYLPLFCQEEIQNDTSQYSMIYISFKGEETPTQMPIYFNGKLIWTLKRYTRMSYKIYSEGILKIERIYKNNFGPSITLYIQHNKNYGIYIPIVSEYATDPKKKFAFNLYAQAGNFFVFLHDDYYGFGEFLSEEKHFVEDRKDPIIKK